MMETCTKLIIFSILFELLKLTSGQPCNSVNCLNFDETVSVSVRYPFRISDRQPKSCGMPGFDLHCHSILGTLIRLQDDVLLGVEGIAYNGQKIFVFDPIDDCFPQKLMALNLDNTPFNPDGISKNFWLYNCSNNDDSFFDYYDRIDCLSGSDYTVISTEMDMSKNRSIPKCKFVKILNVPSSYSFSTNLSDISTIHLNWDGSIVPPRLPVKDLKSGFSSVTQKLWLAVCLCGLVMIIILGYCRYQRNRNEQATSTISVNTITTTSTDITITGLDQATIDSYPVVVIGESGHLVKPDNDTCPICLSDYQPFETLKILPECLHRFHVECIDQWLSSKGVCPICRTSPPRTSLYY